MHGYNAGMSHPVGWVCSTVYVMGVFGPILVPAVCYSCYSMVLVGTADHKLQCISAAGHKQDQVSGITVQSRCMARAINAITADSQYFRSTPPLGHQLDFKHQCRVEPAFF